PAGRRAYARPLRPEPPPTGRTRARRSEARRLPGRRSPRARARTRGPFASRRLAGAGTREKEKPQRRSSSRPRSARHGRTVRTALDDLHPPEPPDRLPPLEGDAGPPPAPPW